MAFEEEVVEIYANVPGQSRRFIPNGNNDSSCRDSDLRSNIRVTHGVSQKYPPSRRARPSCLVCETSLTKRPKIYRWMWHVKRGETIANSTVTCKGLRVTRQVTSRWYDVPNLITASVDLPNVNVGLLNGIGAARVNLSESLGEWRETAQAVRGGAMAIKDAWGHILKLSQRPRKQWPTYLRNLWVERYGKWGTTPLNIHTVPNAYVMTQFGILPYTQLANDSAEALLHRATTKPILQVVRRSASKTVREELTHPNGGQLIRTATCSVRSVAYVFYEPNLGSFTSGNMGAGLWAGLPLSFMVDYFIGIGQWLSAIDGLDGVRRVYGTTSVKTKFTNVDRQKNRSVDENITRPGRYTREEYYRNPLNLQLPYVPELHFSAGLGQLTSALALLDSVRSHPRNVRNLR